MNYTNIQVKILKDLEKAEKDKEAGLHQFKPWTIGQIGSYYYIFGKDIIEIIPMHHFFLHPMGITGGLLPKSKIIESFPINGKTMSRAYKYHDENGEKFHVYTVEGKKLVHIMNKQLYDFDISCKKHETTLALCPDGWCTILEDGQIVGRVKPHKVEG